jgi:hypothetical protein
MKATYNPATKELSIVVPCNDVNPPVSATGKSRAVASSRGNVKTDITILGKPLVIGFNAYIPTK